MRGKFVLAPNGDQLVPSCLSVVQGLSAFQGVHLEGFNCTPTNVNLGSPTQQLMGHHTKTLLPTTCNLLPKIIKPSSVKSALFKQKNTQKYYYDQKSRILPPLNTGDQVKFRSGAVWLPGVVTKVSDSPRSYVITTLKGKLTGETGDISGLHIPPRKMKRVTVTTISRCPQGGHDMVQTANSPSKSTPSVPIHCGDLHNQLHNHLVTYADPYTIRF